MKAKYIFIFAILFIPAIVFADVEFLIYARPSNVANGGYDYGDIVVVREYGWAWGKEELDTKKFFILRVRDMELKEAETYLQEKKVDLIPVARREYQLPISSLPVAVKSEILDKGTLTMDKGTLLSYILKK